MWFLSKHIVKHFFWMPALNKLITDKWKKKVGSAVVSTFVGMGLVISKSLTEKSVVAANK